MASLSIIFVFFSIILIKSLVLTVCSCVNCGNFLLTCSLKISLSIGFKIGLVTYKSLLEEKYVVEKIKSYNFSSISDTSSKLYELMIVISGKVSLIVDAIISEELIPFGHTTSAFNVFSSLL